MSTDILFTLTPSGQDDETNLRRYRAAKAAAAALREPLNTFLRDWAPAHVSRFAEMDRRQPLEDYSEKNVVYFCPSCKSTRLGFTAPAEFEFDGEDHTTDSGIGVLWDDHTEAYCRDCSTGFVLGDSFRPREEGVKVITNVADLAEHLGADPTEASIAKRIYRATECGAWLKITDDATNVEIGSIVEGVDGPTAGPEVLTFPFTVPEFDAAVQTVEDQASEIWNATHGCEQCGPEDDGGYRHVNPECAGCKGEGVII
jgi:hypothetical protein